MDLTAWLLRHTPPRPLVVTTPGGAAARVAVERVVRERGWRAAMSPAEANLLVVTGPVGHDVRPYVDQLWSLVPAPRARAEVGAAATVPTALDAAVAGLREVDQQRRQATHCAHDGDEMPGHRQGKPEGNDDGGHSGHEQHQQGHKQSEQHSHGHHGHDMGDMKMPGNVPMADRAEDRDGLMLDQLHVPLGPLLPDWPAGLVVRTSVQGEVIQEAAIEVVGLGDVEQDAVPNSPWQLTVERLDSCARLLSVAGWGDAATTARRLRDHALCRENRAETARSLERWARSVRRSRTLRWSLSGIGALPDPPSIAADLAGDALTRLHRWIDTAVRAFHERGPESAATDRSEETRWIVDALPRLLEGSELAIARLLVASLDPDLTTLAGREVHHG